MVAELPPVVICRVCGCERLLVRQTRRTSRGTVRYRRCPDCGAVYRTAERVECRIGKAANGLVRLLDEAADVAVGFLRHTDEDGIPGDDLYTRVRRRVPKGVTEAGFVFRLAEDPRVVLGDDSRYRLKTPTA